VTSDQGQGEIEEGTQILSKKFVELVVGADPCPLDSIAATFTDHANVPAYSRRPIIGVSAEFFELQRIVSWIFQKKSKGRRAAFFCAEFNSSYACQKLRVTREITCDSDRGAHCLRLSLVL